MLITVSFICKWKKVCAFLKMVSRWIRNSVWTCVKWVTKMNSKIAATLNTKLEMSILPSQVA